MEKPLVTAEEIAAYIPQKAPIIMVDTIDEVSGNHTITSLGIRPSNMFVHQGSLSEAGIIENIAQTAAAKAGYEVKKNGAEPLIGFIGAIKDLKIHFLPKVGEILKTKITIKNEVMGVTIVDGISECDNKTVAECEMKIFIRQPNP